MEVEKIALQNFRNFSTVQELAFPPRGLLIAAAPNATGKTNFLESIFILLRGRSFRADLDSCARWGTDGFLIQGVTRHGEENSRVAVRYHRPSRRLRIDEGGEPVSLVTFYSHYPLVLFLPDDTFLFARGPAQRRNFLNQTLVAFPSYLSALVQYQRALRQRNAALKQAGTAAAIDTWTEMISEHAAEVWNQRELFGQFLQTHLTTTYEQIFQEELPLSSRINFGVSDRSRFPTILRAAFAAERRAGYTLFGPHRDDLVIESSGRSVDTALSRGQVRGLVVALKVISYQFLWHSLGETPLFLLDEVFGELDAARQRTLLAALPQAGQVVLTCTDIPDSVRTRDDVQILDLRRILAGDAGDAVVPPPALVAANRARLAQPAPVRVQ